MTCEIIAWNLPGQTGGDGGDGDGGSSGDAAVAVTQTTAFEVTTSTGGAREQSIELGKTCDCLINPVQIAFDLCCYGFASPDRRCTGVTALPDPIAPHTSQKIQNPTMGSKGLHAQTTPSRVGWLGMRSVVHKGISDTSKSAVWQRQCGALPPIPLSSPVPCCAPLSVPPASCRSRRNYNGPLWYSHCYCISRTRSGAPRGRSSLVSKSYGSCRISSPPRLLPLVVVLV